MCLNYVKSTTSIQSQYKNADVNSLKFSNFVIVSKIILYTVVQYLPDKFRSTIFLALLCIPSMQLLIAQ